LDAAQILPLACEESLLFRSKLLFEFLCGERIRKCLKTIPGVFAAVQEFRI